MKKNKELIILQGLPGCGKSTWARKYVEGKTDWVIVNRDSLRNMRGDYWIPSQEKLITDWEVFCIDSAMKKGFNVIIDATNFNPKVLKVWEELAEKHEYSKLIYGFDTSLEECIERDSKREKPVGSMVIRRFYNMYLKPKEEVTDEVK